MIKANYIWDKEELPQLWKEFCSVPVCKKGDENNCRKYEGSITVINCRKILFHIHLSDCTPFVEVATGDHYCRC
jgi:hypothetical protein